MEIDRKACQGSGACVETCLEVFQLPEVDGKPMIGSGKRFKKGNEVVSKVVEVDELEFVRGAETCPFNMIHMLTRHVSKGEIQP